MGGGTGESSFERPAADIVLPVVDPSRGAHSDHGAAVLKPHRVSSACSDLFDLRPVAEIAPSPVFISHGDHGTAVLKPHSVVRACGDLDDIPPPLLDTGEILLNV
jgi:hypothetical protein